MAKVCEIGSVHYLCAILSVFLLCVMHIVSGLSYHLLCAAISTADDIYASYWRTESASVQAIVTNDRRKAAIVRSCCDSCCVKRRLCSVDYVSLSIKEHSDDAHVVRILHIADLELVLESIGFAGF